MAQDIKNTAVFTKLGVNYFLQLISGNQKRKIKNYLRVRSRVDIIGRKVEFAKVDHINEGGKMYSKLSNNRKEYIG